MKEDFASMFEQSPAATARKTVRLAAGQKVEGTVLAISGGLVVLDIGSSADASMDVLEFEDRPVQVGDKIQATVSNPRSDGPVLTLSLGKGGAGIDSQALQIALESGTPVSGTVTASNKGGFSVEVAGIRAFCPISQIDTNFVNDPEIFVGQTFDFLVTEIREGGRNVVVSRRKLLEDERRKNEEQLVAQLTTGALVSGVIKKTIRHGAIVDLGGAEGFIPISELSRARVETPEHVVTVGETVQAQVLSLDRTEKGLSIRLSLKALEGPMKESAIEKDELLTGKVVKHVPNGLIVSTPKGEGLVPTRELSLAPGAEHRRSYPIDTELTVVLVNRDAMSGKLRFSVDKVAHVQERNNFREFGKGPQSGGGSFGSLGEVMAKKMGALSAMAAQGSTARPGATASPGPTAAKGPPASQSADGSPGHPRPGRESGVTRRKR